MFQEQSWGAPSLTPAECLGRGDCHPHFKISQLTWDVKQFIQELQGSGTTGVIGLPVKFTLRGHFLKTYQRIFSCFRESPWDLGAAWGRHDGATSTGVQGTLLLADREGERSGSLGMAQPLTLSAIWRWDSRPQAAEVKSSDVHRLTSSVVMCVSPLGVRLQEDTDRWGQMASGSTVLSKGLSFGIEALWVSIQSLLFRSPGTFVL